MKKSIIYLLITFVFLTAKSQVLSPAQFLGYELGERFTPHHQVVSYFQHVADQSPMVQLKEYGRTYENRPLLLATISTEKNIRQIETIRTDNLKRAGILAGNPTTAIAITWLSYNVHGNESNSTEASMMTLYELVRSGSDYAKYLDNSIVIIDPCMNPDGRDRYVNFYNQYGQFPFQPDNQSLEHLEPWPGGRQNHYLFDLNRDWAWQTQIETQRRLEVYNQWLPHIHVDFHEQGYNNPYYFAPAAEPLHELISSWQREFQVTIGKNHARYFDKNNWFYFTKQRFDLLYPSFGDTYPTFNGAIGMTYEQAGSGRAGLGIIIENGDTLTLLDRLTHHHTTGVSTIEVTSMNTDRVLKEFTQFFKTPVKSTYKTFIVKNDNQDKIDALKAWLDINNIQYGSAQGGGKAVTGFHYNTGKNQSYTASPNDLVVSVIQPKGVLAAILFEPKTKLTDSLTYDITAWAAPYIYGLDAIATTVALPVNVEKFKAEPANQSVPENTYAFFFKWNAFQDAQFLATLLKNGVKVRFNELEVGIYGKKFSPGTLIVTKGDNKHLGSDFEKIVTNYANQSSRKFEVVNTGFMESGPDLGSSDIKLIKTPRVAMIAGDGSSVTNVGANWYFLEQELMYPFSMIHTAHLNRTDFSNYDVIILQDGWYGQYLGDSQMKSLSEWVRNGGRLIVIQGALSKFADSDFSSLSQFNSDDEKKEKEKIEEDIDQNNRLLEYGDQEREYAKEIVPGAIFRVTLDNTHPLAFGYGKNYYSLKTSNDRYGYLSSQNVGIIKSKEDYLAGFAGMHVLNNLPQSLIFGVENKGRGQIVYFVDNPLFRAFWYNGKLMYANALFLVGQ